MQKFPNSFHKLIRGSLLAYLPKGHSEQRMEEVSTEVHAQKHDTNILPRFSRNREENLRDPSCFAEAFCGGVFSGRVI